MILPNCRKMEALYCLMFCTDKEYETGAIEGSIHIPLNQLRDRLHELDASKTIYVNCRSGQRSYIACRILTQHGFACSNLSGGYEFYHAVISEQHDKNKFVV